MTKKKNPVKVIMIGPTVQAKKIRVDNAIKAPVTGVTNGKGKGKAAPKSRASRA